MALSVALCSIASEEVCWHSARHVQCRSAPQQGAQQTSNGSSDRSETFRARSSNPRTALQLISGPSAEGLLSLQQDISCLRGEVPP